MPARPVETVDQAAGEALETELENGEARCGSGAVCPGSGAKGVSAEVVSGSSDQSMRGSLRRSYTRLPGYSRRLLFGLNLRVGLIVCTRGAAASRPCRSRLKIST